MVGQDGVNIFIMDMEIFEVEECPCMLWLCWCVGNEDGEDSVAAVK